MQSGGLNFGLFCDRIHGNSAFQQCTGSGKCSNSIHIRQLCMDIMAALHHGRSERTPVLVFAGRRGGEEKSMMLKALLSVYGHEHVFSKPESRGGARGLMMTA